MRVLYHPTTGEVEISGDRAGLMRLAESVRAGAETDADAQAGDVPPGLEALSEVRIQDAPGRLRIDVDGALRSLTISGGPDERAVLADIVEDTAAMDDGGHSHVEYYPGHPFLAAGALPLVLISPHGGMPRRTSPAADG